MLVTTIAIGHWLDAPAAASYQRMRQAGMPAGGITDAGRTNAEQWDLWRAYLAGKLKATAAYPGTSKHETGRALDLTGAALAWARAYGRDFGWIPDLVPHEPWHLEYRANRDKYLTTPGGDDVFTDADKEWFKAVLRAPEFDVSAYDRAWDVVSRWYVDLLGRPGSASEIAPWAKGMADGAAYASVYASIYDSDEAKAYRSRKPAVEPTPLAFDYAALARAVNDDAARRLAN